MHKFKMLLGVTSQIQKGGRLKCQAYENRRRRRHNSGHFLHLKRTKSSLEPILDRLSHSLFAVLQRRLAEHALFIIRQIFSSATWKIINISLVAGYLEGIIIRDRKSFSHNLKAETLAFSQGRNWF